MRFKDIGDIAHLNDTAALRQGFFEFFLGETPLHPGLYDFNQVSPVSLVNPQALAFLRKDALRDLEVEIPQKQNKLVAPVEMGAQELNGLSMSAELSITSNQMFAILQDPRCLLLRLLQQLSVAPLCRGAAHCLGLGVER